MDYLLQKKRKMHPKDRSNIISKILFLYTAGMFRKGFKKEIEEIDLYEVPSEFRATELGNDLEKEWKKQTISKKKSILSLLAKCYGTQYLLLGLIQFVNSIAGTIIPSYATGKIVSYFTPGQKEITRGDAYFYATVLISFILCGNLWKFNYYLLLGGLGIKIRSAFTSLLYRKVLKLNTSSFNISVGKIITLITKDVNSFDYFLEHGNDIWSAPLTALIITWVIYSKVGTAALMGFCSMLIIVPLQIYIGSRITGLKMKMCKATDDRIHITHEMLSAIRIIKMYTLEKIFINKILLARKKEVYITYKLFFLKFLVRILGHLNSHLAFYTLMMTYIWLGNDIRAETVYFIKSSFQSVSFGLAFHLPIAIFQAAEVKSAVNRTGSLMKAEEIKENERKTNTNDPSSIVFDDVTVTLGKTKLLKEINFTIKDKGLTVVTGAVGSGKTVLLKTIIKDYKPEQGEVKVQGGVSYASQEPWIFPSTIRQNILFGEKYNKNRYQEVLRACALVYDLELLQSGDKTIVEDRGSNLSKGQQARINLARAVYKEREIYVMDDPLSALDVHVKVYIFRECMKRFLKNKLVILVTNDLSCLKHADIIIAMENGKIQSITKCSQLLNTNYFSEHLGTFCSQNESKANRCVSVIPTVPITPVYQENKKSGKIDTEVYKKYVQNCGGFFIVFLVISVFVISQFTISYIEKLISKWVDLEERIFNNSHSNSSNVTLHEKHEEMLQQRTIIIVLYNFLMVGLLVTSLGRTASLQFVTRKASIKFHKDMLKNVVNATTKFFDYYSMGNILNRFSKDLIIIDEEIPMELEIALEVILYLMGAITLLLTINTTLLIAIIIFFGVLYIGKKCSINVLRSLQRLDMLTRSPVVGYINTTLEGLTTIRALNTENLLKTEFDRHQDLYNSTSFTLRSNWKFLAHTLNCLSVLFTGAIILRFLISATDTSAGDVGLAISQSFNLTSTLQWAICEWIEIENLMTSAERVLEYIDIDQEDKQGLELKNWPTRGQIQFENVHLRYNTRLENAVLKNLNFTVLPKEKIGIVGRTGAGKSSIISVLFRLYEAEGRILIDGIDIKTLSLNFLRSNISIIPQDPILFSGTIRDNIDPFNKHSDEDIWKVIETVHLTPSISNLDLIVSASGLDFSAGQKQLICIARAILQRNKIIVLDEATANMDCATETLIHQTILENFVSSTVLLITHKLNKTVHYCDKIIVLDKGEIVEYGKPKNLLEDKNSRFYQMIASVEPNILENVY